MKIVFLLKCRHAIFLSFLFINIFFIATPTHAQNTTNNKIVGLVDGSCMDIRDGTSLATGTNCSSARHWNFTSDMIRTTASRNQLDFYTLCLQSDGGVGTNVRVVSCNNNDASQKWTFNGSNFYNKKTGLCLNQYWNSNVFADNCNSPLSNYRSLYWSFGPSVSQTALNCKFSSSTSAYLNAAGNAMNANDMSAGGFTLARLQWGNDTSDQFMVRNNSNGLCFSKAGGPLSCDPQDQNQRYNIIENTGQLRNWMQSFIPSDMRRPVKATDVFGNPNKPLNRLWVSNPDTLLSNVSNPLYMECGHYSIRNVAASPAKNLDENILRLRYIQNVVKALNREANQATLRDYGDQYITAFNHLQLKYPTLTSQAPATQQPTSINMMKRTLKFYDFSVETATDAGKIPIVLDVLADTNGDIVRGFYQIVNDLIPDWDQLSLDIKNKTSAYGDTIASMNTNGAGGRKLLMASGSTVSAQVALQFRIPFRFGSDVTKISYLPTNGNIRISIPAMGPKATANNGVSDPGHSYSDFVTQRNDGVFNYVLTLELDRELIKKNNYLNPFLQKWQPTVGVGVELVFAMSYRASGNGSKTRVDSIAVNAISDVGMDDGLIGMWDRVRTKTRPTRVVQTGARNEASRQVSSPTLISDLAADNAELAAQTVIDITPASSVSNYSASTEFLSAASSAVSSATSPSLNSASFTSAGSGANWFNQLAAMELPDAAAQLAQRIDALNYPAFKVTHSLGVIGEGQVALKWFNPTFTAEMSCRYRNPSTSSAGANCKNMRRDGWSFNWYPNALEFVGLGIGSYMLNNTVDYSNTRFFANNPVLKSVAVAPRVQFSTAGSYWIAFDLNSADALRAGAALATRAAD